jgi:hypothetical protein
MQNCQALDYYYTHFYFQSAELVAPAILSPVVLVTGHADLWGSALTGPLYGGLSVGAAAGL